MDTNLEQDEAHSLSEKQSNTDDHKLATTAAVLTDPNFPLPTLDSRSSVLTYAKSFAVLSGLLAGGIFGTWYMGASLLQSESPVLLLGGVFLALMAVLFATGTVWVDWWELVLGYWWLSMPIGAAAGLAFVLNQEAATQLTELQ